MFSPIWPIMSCWITRARRTPRELFKLAVDSLDCSNVIGIALNDVDTKHSRYASAYRYYQEQTIRNDSGTPGSTIDTSSTAKALKGIINRMDPGLLLKKWVA